MNESLLAHVVRTLTMLFGMVLLMLLFGAWRGFVATCAVAAVAASADMIHIRQLHQDGAK